MASIAPSLIILLLVCVEGTVYYVSGDASAPCDASGVPCSFASAMDLAVSGDFVRLLPGVIEVTAKISWNASKTNIVVASVAPDPTQSVLRIAITQGTGVVGIDLLNVHSVLFANLTVTCISDGGAFFVRSSSATNLVRFQQVRFVGSRYTGGSSLIRVRGQTDGHRVVFSNCLFEDNRMEGRSIDGDSGPVALSGGFSSFQDCSFFGNSVTAISDLTALGGALSHLLPNPSGISVARVEIERCLFSGNFIGGNEGFGGAVYFNGMGVSGSALSIRNTRFESNFSPNDGGAIFSREVRIPFHANISHLDWQKQKGCELHYGDCPF